MKHLVLSIIIIMSCFFVQTFSFAEDTADSLSEVPQIEKPAGEEFYTPEDDIKRLEETSIEESTELPNVLIIGDSISIGYTPFVKNQLEGTANVKRIPGNGGNTANWVNILTENPEKWLGTDKLDVIHFNAGLWDIAYRSRGKIVPKNLDKENGKLTATPEEYKENLTVIVEILKATGAKLIWASTTVVPEGEPGRFKGDEVIYNQIVEEVMLENGVAINDLFSVTNEFDQSLSTESGNVHFTKEGYKILGEKVAEAIKMQLLGVRR